MLWYLNYKELSIMNYKMKVYNLPKRFSAKGDFEGLLKHFNLVEDGQASPGRIYMSKEDLRRFEKAYKKATRKQNSFYTKKHVDCAWGMYNLNLGPNQSLELAIKPGYVIVEERESK